MGVKFSNVHSKQDSPRTGDTAKWCPLPSSMVLRSEGSLKSEMLSLARTSKYVNNTTVLVCKSYNSEEDSLNGSDSQNWIVIIVTDPYSCFLIELMCQTKNVYAT